MLLGLAIVLGAASVVLLVLAWRGLRPSRAFLARRTTPIGSIRPGPVAVAGVIRAAEGHTLLGGPGLGCRPTG